MIFTERKNSFFLFFGFHISSSANIMMRTICRQFSSHAEELLLSASRGQPLVGATSQTDLVLRMKTAGILTDCKACHAMSLVCRSKFVNQAKEKVLVFGGNEEERDVNPFENKPQPLGSGGATISTPQFHGEVLQALSESLSRQGSSALDIGTGTGYMACVFAQMVGSNGKVVAVDALEPLVNTARKVAASILPDVEKQTKKNAASIEFLVADDFHQNDQHIATFDTIYCAPAVSSSAQVSNLSRLLNVGGTMLVPLNNVWSGEQTLLKVVKGHDGDIEETKIGPVACQPVLEGEVLSAARAPPPPPPPSRTDELKQMKQALADWTSEFEQEHGRRPNRTDLSEHPVGAPLFKRFALATKIGTVMD